MTLATLDLEERSRPGLKKVLKTKIILLAARINGRRTLVRLNAWRIHRISMVPDKNYCPTE